MVPTFTRRDRRSPLLLLSTIPAVAFLQSHGDCSKGTVEFASQIAVIGAGVTVRRADLGSFRKSAFWPQSDSAKGGLGFVSKIVFLARKTRAGTRFGIDINRMSELTYV